MKVRGQAVIDPEIRIQRNSVINPNTGCWEWSGTKKGKGKLKQYGSMTVGSRADGSRRTISAHRYSYEVFVGAIPEGMVVMHSCDNPCCVNPEHLSCGTQIQNIEDREAKGRNKPFEFGKNEQHSKAILDWDKVNKIRSLKRQRGFIAKAAKEFGVNYKTISDVLNNRTWVVSTGSADNPASQNPPPAE